MQIILYVMGRFVCYERLTQFVKIAQLLITFGWIIFVMLNYFTLKIYWHCWIIISFCFTWFRKLARIIILLSPSFNLIIIYCLWQKFKFFFFPVFCDITFPWQHLSIVNTLHETLCILLESLNDKKMTQLNLWFYDRFEKY